MKKEENTLPHLILHQKEGCANLYFSCLIQMSLGTLHKKGAAPWFTAPRFIRKGFASPFAFADVFERS